MKKFRNFVPTLTDLSEFMFVQMKNDELQCFEVRISDYDHAEKNVLKGLILEATEIKDEILYTKKKPLEYIDIERDKVEAILLGSK